MLRFVFVGVALVTTSGCVESPITVSGRIDLGRSGCEYSADHFDLELMDQDDGSSVASATIGCGEVGSFYLDAPSGAYALHVEAQGCGNFFGLDDQVIGELDLGLGEIATWKDVGTLAIPTSGCD